MENKKLDQFQNQEYRIEPKIRVSKDGKWVIEKLPRDEIELFLKDNPISDVVIIKAVAYFEKILENAKKKAYGTTVEKVKG